MRKLIKECAPWLNWKVVAVFAAVVGLVFGFIIGADAGRRLLLARHHHWPLGSVSQFCLIPLRFEAHLQRRARWL